MIADEERVVYGKIAVYAFRDRMVELQRQHCEAVIAGAEDLLKKSAVPYTKEILVGRVAEAIATCADERGCGGIVMGTRGMTPIRNLVMGSVATKVVHLSTVLVTLVKWRMPLLQPQVCLLVSPVEEWPMVTVWNAEAIVQDCMTSADSRLTHWIPR